MKHAATKASIDRLRFIGKLEGLSFIALLGIAMPLKYIAKIPEPVKYTGWLHGLLFVLFCFAILHTLFLTKWSLLRGFILFCSSLIPFGPFLLDKHIVVERDKFQ